MAIGILAVVPEVISMVNTAAEGIENPIINNAIHEITDFFRDFMELSTTRIE